MSRLLLGAAAVSMLSASVLAEPRPGAWQPVPWVSAEHREAGVQIGGEGAQWPGDLAIDATDGRLMVFATDVGGLYRSVDQGQTWEPANVGFTPRGARDLEIDPHNPDRVIAIASNSMARDIHGVYLSENGAASWKMVHPINMGGMRDRRRSVVFDPATFDEDANLTRRVYWSRTNEELVQYGEMPEQKPGLYRSDDGGRTWERLGEASDVAGASHIAVHPTSGRLYVGNESGFYLSDNGGESFRQIGDEHVTAVEVSVHEPDQVWATTATKIYQSDDAGETWQELAAEGLQEPLTMPDGTTASPRQNVRFQGLVASPAEPGQLAMRSLADDWQWHKHVSHDGGQTWQVASTSSELAFLPQNARQYTFAWHPTDADRVWSYGGDWITASTDAGLNYDWASEGQNAVLVGGGMAFNAHHPELIFLGSQDYNGAVTHDGGHTWTYTNVSDKSWGGFTYGGLAINPDVLVVGLAPSWTGDRQLRMSRDGGETWADVEGVTWAKDRDQDSFGSSRGYVSPNDPDVAFIAGFRTNDAGETWQRMEDITGVYASDASGRLYGVAQFKNYADIVRSDDDGQTWQVIAAHDGPISALSPTPDGDVIYLTDVKALYRADLTEIKGTQPARGEMIETPKTASDRRRVTGVAVDPSDPDTLYITQHLNVESASVSLARSTDGGQTWQVLNANQPLDGTVLDGGREAMYVEIDPSTGHVWTPTSCYGIWKYVPDRETRDFTN
jgi:photosystem II stability/assembly factor-like uncharacterized protein